MSTQTIEHAPAQRQDTPPDSGPIMRRAAVLPNPGDWQTMLQMAEAFFKSGLLPTSVKNTQAALLIIQKGRELGLEPTYALSNISVVQGKPVVGAEVMLTLIYRDHGADAWEWLETSDTTARARFKRRGARKPSEYAFTLEMAKSAGLLGKDNWKHYPAAMLRARCISAVARMAFPDSIAGMYTPDEMGVEIRVDESGGSEILSPSVTSAPSIESETTGYEATDTDWQPSADSTRSQPPTAESLRGFFSDLARRKGVTVESEMVACKAELGLTGRLEEQSGEQFAAVYEWLLKRFEEFGATEDRADR